MDSVSYEDHPKDCLESEPMKSTENEESTNVLTTNDTKLIRSKGYEDETIQEFLRRPSTLSTNYEYVKRIIDQPEVIRRLSLQGDSKELQAVALFMNEVMYTISDVNQANRSNSLKNLRSILNWNRKNGNQDKMHRKEVHFSEENIYILIPRVKKNTSTIIGEKLCYYCCFGYLFPK